MRTDWVAATGQNSSGGAPGTGTFTLVALPPWLNFNQVFGTSGNSRYVDYEADDGTNFEEGVGVFTPGSGNTAMLTRIPTSVASASAGITNTGTINPFNFTTVPTVRITPRSRNTLGTPPGVPTVGDGYGDYNALGVWGSNGWSFAASSSVLVPFWWHGQHSIKSAAIYVDTASAGVSLRVGLYDWGNDGCPHNLIEELTATTQFSLGTTGWQALTAPTSFNEINPPPGYYFLYFSASAASGVVHGTDLQVNSHLGTNGNRFQKTLGTTGLSYGALPASISSGNIGAGFSSSNGFTVPGICFK